MTQILNFHYASHIDVDVFVNSISKESQIFSH